MTREERIYWETVIRELRGIRKDLKELNDKKEYTVFNDGKEVATFKTFEEAENYMITIGSYKYGEELYVEEEM